MPMRMDNVSGRDRSIHLYSLISTYVAISIAMEVCLAVCAECFVGCKSWLLFFGSLHHAFLKAWKEWLNTSTDMPILRLHSTASHTLPLRKIHGGCSGIEVSVARLTSQLPLIRGRHRWIDQWFDYRYNNGLGHIHGRTTLQSFRVSLFALFVIVTIQLSYVVLLIPSNFADTHPVYNDNGQYTPIVMFLAFAIGFQCCKYMPTFLSALVMFTLLSQLYRYDSCIRHRSRGLHYVGYAWLLY